MSHLPPPPPAQRDRLLGSNGSSSASAATPATSPPNQASQRRTHNPYDAAWLPWSVNGSRYTDVVKAPTQSQMTHDAAQMTQELKMIPHSVTGLLTEGARLVEASLLRTQPLDSPNALRTDGTHPTTVAPPLHRRLVSVTNIYYGAFDGDLWKVAAFLNGLVNSVVCPAADPTSPFLIRFSPRNRKVTQVPRAEKHLFRNQEFQVEVYAREPSTASTASVNDAKSFTDLVLNHYGRHVRVIFDHGDVLWIHDSGSLDGDSTIVAIDDYVISLRTLDDKTRYARMQGLPAATMGIMAHYVQTGSSTQRK